MDSSANLISSRFTTAMVLSLVLVATCADAMAQQPAGNVSEDRDRGIQLYQQGDFPGAVKLLRSATHKGKTDLSAWHWLGLALERQGKPGDARKAHEKAAKLGDALLMRQVDAAGLDDFAVVISKLKPQIELAAESA